MNFEWDKQKATSNQRKHDVSFDEASSVFDDPLFIDYYDPDHSQAEYRYIIIGQSKQGRLLVVSYTERGNDVRLISARLATTHERRIYEEET